MNEIVEYEKQFSFLVPEFNSYWYSENCYLNHGAESTVHGVFIAFSHIVCKKLEANSLENGSAIFAFIEKVILNGGSSANAACTCFLEGVLNRTPATIKPELFVPFLGEKSKEYCKAWNEFTGVSVVGI